MRVTRRTIWPHVRKMTSLTLSQHTTHRSSSSSAWSAPPFCAALAAFDPAACTHAEQASQDTMPAHQTHITVVIVLVCTAALYARRACICRLYPCRAHMCERLHPTGSCRHNAQSAAALTWGGAMRRAANGTEVQEGSSSGAVPE